MKNLLFVLLFLSFTTHAAITIVSDLDDTIKITQASGDPGDLLGDEIYTGMPDFYHGAREYSRSLHILSASPSFLRSKIQDTLRRNRISYEGLILRSNLFEDKFDYKLKAITRLMDESSDDFLFVGDDLGEDPEVFAEATRLYPGRVLGNYIHVVNGRSLPRGITKYWTSFDLLLMEHENGRMKEGWVKKVFQALSAERDMEMIFPREAQCPSEARVWAWQARTMFSREAQALIKRFTAFCQARQSDNILQ